MVENSHRCADRNHRASEAHARRRSAPTVILTSPEVYPSGRWEVTSAPLLLAPSGILVTSARLRNAAHPIGGCHNLLMYHPGEHVTPCDLRVVDMLLEALIDVAELLLAVCAVVALAHASC
jgi:hypothetical protein